MWYLKYLLGLIFGLLLILLALRPWLRKRAYEFSGSIPYKIDYSSHLREGWEDLPPSSDRSEEAGESKKQTARLNEEYSKYQKWLTSFCKSWDEVAQKAQQAAQYTGSQNEDSGQNAQNPAFNSRPRELNEYIKTLEAKSGITLYKCIPEWGEKPDPIFISQNVPEDATIFKNTIDFMKTQTDNIKANTKSAMQGQISGFQDFSPNCTLGESSMTCIFPLGPGGSILPVNLTPKVLADKLEKLNKQVAELTKPLQEVQANLADLNKTADKAKSGELFKEIQLPTSLPN